MNKITDINLMTKSLLPHKVKVNFTIDIRLRSKLIIKKTIRFTNKSSVYKILSFTQSNSGPLRDIEGFVQFD